MLLLLTQRTHMLCWKSQPKFNLRFLTSEAQTHIYVVALMSAWNQEVQPHEPSHSANRKTGGWKHLLQEQKLVGKPWVAGVSEEGDGKTLSKI